MSKLQLSTDVYSLDNIEKTCTVYKDYAKIKIKKKRHRVEVIFDRCRYDSEITMKEFENYLINVESSRI